MCAFAQKPKVPQQAKSGQSTVPGRTYFGQNREVNSRLHLQRTIGNQTVPRVLQSNTDELEVGLASTASPCFAHDFSQIPVHASAHSNIQSKIKVNAPGHIYEQEADSVADEVIRTPGSQGQRTYARTGGSLGSLSQSRQFEQECNHRQAKRAHEGAYSNRVAPTVVRDVLRSSGQALDLSTRGFFEARLGKSFGEVRIHADNQAAMAASAVSAQAFTVGKHIAFGAGQYMPATFAGRRLLAHELTHVVQQGSADPVYPLHFSAASRPMEREADQAANSILAGFAPSQITGNVPEQIALQDEVPSVSDDVGTTQFGRYVDRFDEIYYDLDYRPAQQGHLSKWLRVSYGDGTLIDINIDEISEDTLSAEQVFAAMRDATIGRGGRIFPTILNRETTPALYAARRSALEAMDESNLAFMTAAMPAVLFVITLPLVVTSLGRPATAVRRPVPRPSTRVPGGSTATSQSAEQIGIAIGKSVSGQSTGKMASIVQQVSARGLSQQGAATATESAVRALGLRVGPRVALPNGNIVVTSVQLGTRQPVLVVQANGSVFRATADLVLDGLEIIVRNVTPM